MLKSAFLLLLLLNSLQISTANSTIEEQRMNEAIEFLNKMAKLDDAMEQFKNMSIHGAKMYEANEKLNALDEIPLQSGWVNKSHVELCSGARALHPSNTSAPSSYNSTFLIEYNQFDLTLSKIPNSDIEVKKIKPIFYEVFDEQRQLEVAHEVHEFTQRLRCLQTMNPSNDEKFIEKMTDLYEAYLYADKYTQDNIAQDKAKRDYESSGSIGIIVLVVIFIALCGCMCWRCAQ